MTLDDSIQGLRLRVLQAATRSGNVSATCRHTAFPARSSIACGLGTSSQARTASIRSATRRGVADPRK